MHVPSFGNWHSNIYLLVKKGPHEYKIESLNPENLSRIKEIYYSMCFENNYSKC